MHRHAIPYASPGALAQVSRSLDAILYLSVLTSRNPEFIFGQHVQAAPMLRAMRLEPISTGYMLFDAGRVTPGSGFARSRGDRGRRSCSAGRHARRQSS